MDEINVFMYWEIDYFVIYLDGRLTFREIWYKDTMDWPATLLVVDTYQGYQSFIPKEMCYDLGQLKNALNQSNNKDFLDELRIKPFRYMNLFATWGPEDGWYLFGGMTASYRRDRDTCGLYDVIFGDKPTDAKLELSCQDFFYFASNLLYDRAHWVYSDNLQKFMNMNPLEQSQFIETVHFAEWSSDKKDRELYKWQGRYLLHYLLYLHDKLLRDELSLEYLFSLNGFTVIGTLVASERVRKKFIDFYTDLISQREKLPRGWRAIVAVIIETTFYTENHHLHYNLLADELGIHSTEPFKDWIKSLEVDEFGCFEHLDEGLKKLREEFGLH